MQEKYADKGLVVLALPCNQFGKQNPEDGFKTQSFCKINYHATFPPFFL
ncbi:hypothetical protein [Solibacillus sp. FSL H8-0538]